MERIQKLLRELLNSRKDIRRRRRGMSLVEIMVVIAIILTLMSIVGFGVIQVWENSKIDITKVSMAGVAEKVQIYTVRNNKPPSTGEGLAAVYQEESPPKDGWSNDFIYVSPGPNGQDFDIVSLGRDGKEGGTDRNADIRLSDAGR